ncbi:MAG: malate synthase A [Alphaproteobacteria bacterium]|nr:malate synthase A [Alphaproteobacteria bacterium]
MVTPLSTPSHPLLTQECRQFLAELHAAFDARRLALLAARREQQTLYDNGATPAFPDDSMASNPDWRVTSTPPDLQDRRVEITGPPSRKMLINALNAGAKTFMACLEDATSPSWHNVMDSQQNLHDAVHRTIAFEDPSSGKQYQLRTDTESLAALIVRPRGWHLHESHASTAEGTSMSGSLFDFGVYLFHNGQRALQNGSGPYFYLPKIEHHQEARLWADVFAFAEQYLHLPAQSIKATVLIETLPAAFHAEDILYQLRAYIVGLNCGRWDYIFSYIKVFRRHPDRILPDRSAVTMTVPFMRAYCLHVIDVCHRRGAHAIGGMAAQIPVRGDEAANAEAFARVRADKTREVTDGHDGTWVAHPGLVPVAMEVFDAHMPTPNQINRTPNTAPAVTAEALTTACDGAKTLAGLRTNIEVGITYLAAWLGGLGAVPIHHLMEDAATAEICRSQLWQWRVNSVTLDGGVTPRDSVTPRDDSVTQVDDTLLRTEIEAFTAALQAKLGNDAYAAQHYVDATALFTDMVFADTPPDFLTIPAYNRFLAAAE